MSEAIAHSHAGPVCTRRVSQSFTWTKRRKRNKKIFGQKTRVYARAIPPRPSSPHHNPTRSLRDHILSAADTRLPHNRARFRSFMNTLARAIPSLRSSFPFRPARPVRSSRVIAVRTRSRRRRNNVITARDLRPGTPLETDYDVCPQESYHYNVCVPMCKCIQDLNIGVRSEMQLAPNSFRYSPTVRSIITAGREKFSVRRLQCAAE